MGALTPLSSQITAWLETMRWPRNQAQRCEPPLWVNSPWLNPLHSILHPQPAARPLFQLRGKRGGKNRPVLENGFFFSFQTWKFFSSHRDINQCVFICKEDGNNYLFSVIQTMTNRMKCFHDYQYNFHPPAALTLLRFSPLQGWRRATYTDFTSKPTIKRRKSAGPLSCRTMCSVYAATTSVNKNGTEVEEDLVSPWKVWKRVL